MEVTKKKTAVPWFEALQGRVLAFSEHCMSWVGFQAEERSRKQKLHFWIGFSPNGPKCVDGKIYLRLFSFLNGLLFVVLASQFIPQ